MNNILKIAIAGGSSLSGNNLTSNIQQRGHGMVPASPAPSVHTTTTARGARSRPMLAWASLVTATLILSSTLMAKETITPLMSNDLAGVRGKEVLMYTVDFPPGFSSPVHRHDAQVSVYVLEGSVVMQVKGGKLVTLRPGQSFYENRSDIHVVSRNASSTKPAKFLVFMVKDKGAPLVKLEK